MGEVFQALTEREILDFTENKIQKSHVDKISTLSGSKGLGMTYNLTNSNEYNKVDNLFNTYLTTISTGARTYTYTIPANITTSMLTAIEYSTDNGKNWTKITNTNSTITGSVSVNNNIPVMWKGYKTSASNTSTGVKLFDSNSGYPTGLTITSTNSYEIYGNIMSLAYGDVFTKKTIKPYFSYMFRDIFINVCDASKLILPNPSYFIPNNANYKLPVLIYDSIFTYKSNYTGNTSPLITFNMAYYGNPIRKTNSTLIINSYEVFDYNLIYDNVNNVSVWGDQLYYNGLFQQSTLDTYISWPIQTLKTDLRVTETFNRKYKFNFVADQNHSLDCGAFLAINDTCLPPINFIYYEDYYNKVPIYLYDNFESTGDYSFSDNLTYIDTDIAYFIAYVNYFDAPVIYSPKVNYIRADFFNYRYGTLLCDAIAPCGVYIDSLTNSGAWEQSINDPQTGLTYMSNWIPSHDYLTFDIIGDDDGSLNTRYFIINIPANLTPAQFNGISYRFIKTSSNHSTSQNISSWENITNVSGAAVQQSFGNDILYPGDKIQIKSLSGTSTTCATSSATGSYTYFSVDVTNGLSNNSVGLDVFGDIRSILYGDTFISGKNYPEYYSMTGANYSFCGLFSNLTCLRYAHDLRLPYNSLGTYSYMNMFIGCNNLLDTPKLPATYLATGCYYGMFDGCSSLLEAPELPSNIISSRAYYYMFRNCISLEKTPELNAEILTGTYNYCGMFYGCSGLLYGPEILPATTLTNYCYYQMFYGCSGLLYCPDLPATTLATNCYWGMFQKCKSITSSPRLCATELVSGCYNSMFSECSKLNYIYSMMLTGSTTYSSSWVNAISATGVFIGNESMNNTGNNGIHNNWIKQTTDYLVFDCIEENQFTFTYENTNSRSNTNLSYSLDYGQTWTSVTGSCSAGSIYITTPIISEGSKILWKGNVNPNNEALSGHFNSKGYYKIMGNIKSITNNSIGNYKFSHLFSDNKYLLSSRDLIIQQNSETLSEGLCLEMFNNCYNLIQGPIQSISGAFYKNTFNKMFYNCGNLKGSFYSINKTNSDNLSGTFYSMYTYCCHMKKTPKMYLYSTNNTNHTYDYMYDKCPQLQKTYINVSNTSNLQGLFGLVSDLDYHKYGLCCTVSGIWQSIEDNFNPWNGAYEAGICETKVLDSHYTY